MHPACPPSITVCQPQSLAGAAGTSRFPPAAGDRAPGPLSLPEALLAGFCVLCAPQSCPHPLTHLVLPSLLGAELFCRANCAEPCSGGARLLCCPVPVAFCRLTPLVSCSSSPLNHCCALTSYEYRSDSDMVGKIHLSFRGIWTPPKEKSSTMKRNIWGGEGGSGKVKIAVEI